MRWNPPLIDRDHPTTKAVDEYRQVHLSNRLPAYTMVGGYRLLYFCADGGVLCADCANGDNGSDVGSDDATYDDGTTDPQWTIAAVDVYWEGPPIYCDHCNAEIESSYGDPEQESD